MDTNLPSLARTRFHSLNRHNINNSNNSRRHHTNNLDLDPSTSPGLYCTLAHPRPHVRLMPAPETRPEPVYCGSSREEAEGIRGVKAAGPQYLEAGLWPFV